MIRFLALIVSGLVLFTLFCFADDETRQPVLVELFANQNCSACPQAHRTMREVTRTRDDVLVVTWVVDYWDYLGEPDPMSMPEANLRQAAYADWLELRAPYTPQSIYNGVKECPGPRKKQVLNNIDSIATEGRPQARLSEAGGRISVSSRSLENAQLVRLRYLPAQANDTGMVNPVTAVQGLDGQIGVLHDCERDCAVLLQSQETGEILAFWQPDLLN